MFISYHDELETRTKRSDLLKDARIFVAYGASVAFLGKTVRFGQVIDGHVSNH